MLATLGSARSAKIPGISPKRDKADDDGCHQKHESDRSLDAPGLKRLERTRANVVSGWVTVANNLSIQGAEELATKVTAFFKNMPPPLTDNARLVSEIAQANRAKEPAARGPTR